MARWKAHVEFLLSVTEHLFLFLTVEALQGKTWGFQGEGLVPCQYKLIDATRKAIDCATTLPLRVFI